MGFGDGCRERERERDGLSAAAAAPTVKRNTKVIVLISGALNIPLGRGAIASAAQRQTQ